MASGRARAIAAVAIGSVIGLAVGAALVLGGQHSASRSAVTRADGGSSPRGPATRADDLSPAAERDFPAPAPLSAAQIAALPEARYDAVIAGLLEYRTVVVRPPLASPPGPIAYSLAADTALYGGDHVTPVARFAARDFLGRSTVVVAVARATGWSLVLTPSRQRLPSSIATRSPPGAARHDVAPAQTAAWIRTTALRAPVTLSSRIIVSVAAQTLTITTAGSPPRSFPVGVGTPSTPTPTGVTGYLEARYLDPAQNQSAHPVQLTSLHSSAADNPFGGDDGGLIGIHFEQVASGAVSHGCIRVRSAVLDAVNALPLGTPVEISG